MDVFRFTMAMDVARLSTDVVRFFLLIFPIEYLYLFLICSNVASETDSVIASDAIVEPSDSACKYGELTLQIGEKLNSEEMWNCASCMCKTPPMVDCIIDPVCYNPVQVLSDEK